jgi:hypothetical protein
MVISLPKIPYVHRISKVLANPIYDQLSDDFPAKNAVCTPYLYMVLIDPKYREFALQILLTASNLCAS